MIFFASGGVVILSFYKKELCKLEIKSIFAHFQLPSVEKKARKAMKAIPFTVYESKELTSYQRDPWQDFKI